MLHNNVSMAIIINGSRDHTAREYISPINRQYYVEGREGSNFTIRIHNKNNFRVLAIPSVDGLSVLDGKPAGEQSPGYVLAAREILDIPGWMVDGNTAAKFFFAGLKANGEDESYAAQSGQSTANKGIIGLKVFAEKVTNPHYSLPLRSAGIFASGVDMAAGSTLSCSTARRGMTASASASTASMNACLAAAPALGTGFGEAQEFNTSKTNFDRGDLLAMIVIYYDDKRGLKKMGIDVDQPIASSPSAFPADEVGCNPPSGWQR